MPRPSRRPCKDCGLPTKFNSGRSRYCRQCVRARFAVNINKPEARRKMKATRQAQADRVLEEVLDEYFVSHGIGMDRAITP